MSEQGEDFASDIERRCMEQHLAASKADTGKHGHTYEALSRRVANYRRNLRQLQRAHLTTVHALDSSMFNNAKLFRERHESYKERDAAKRDAEYWRDVARRDKRFVVVMSTVVPIISYLIGYLIAGQ